jgi:hypothetical protein
MRLKHFLLTTFLVCCLQGISQNSSFGLIKYNFPDTWSEQIKSKFVSYTGIDAETNVHAEIRIHSPETAAPKPDSSFRLAWKNYFEPAAVPVAKKIFTDSGIPLVYNPAFPAVIEENSNTLYKQLITVVVDQQMQVIEVIAGSEKDLRQLRNFLQDFVSGIDTIVKRPG